MMTTTRVAQRQGRGKKGYPMKGKIFKLVLFLLVAGGIAVVGFAYFGDLSPTQLELRKPVTLNVD